MWAEVLLPGAAWVTSLLPSIELPLILLHLLLPISAEGGGEWNGRVHAVGEQGYHQAWASRR